MLKRPSSSNENETALVKRNRVDEMSSALVLSEPISSALALLPGSDNKSNRRSGLQDMNMMLSGHEGAVFSLCFDSTGNNLASSSVDSKICKPPFTCRIQLPYRLTSL
jgi:WD40 repeat protein